MVNCSVPWTLPQTERRKRILVFFGISFFSVHGAAWGKSKELVLTYPPMSSCPKVVRLNTFPRRGRLQLVLDCCPPPQKPTSTLADKIINHFLTPQKKCSYQLIRNSRESDWMYVFLPFPSPTEAENLRQALDGVQCDEDLSTIWRDISPRDKLVYIYTSGTTGMPKAAVITNSRYEISVW